MDKPLTREEVAAVIEGRGCARRIPLMIHQWLYPEVFTDPAANARVRELMAQYPNDAAFIRWRFIKLWDAPPDDPDYRWMHGTKPAQDSAAAIDAAGPLSDWAMLDDILEHFPKASYPGLLADIPPEDGRYRVGHWWYNYFERHWQLRGMSNALMDYYTHPDEVHRLFGALTGFYIGMMKRMKEAGADAIYTTDDIGTQTGPFFSPEIFDEFYAPYYKRQIDAAHEMGMHFWLHSCGEISLHLPKLIELGLDVIHPIQKFAMNPEETAARYGGKVCFWAGFDVQQTIPYGTGEDVRAEVRRLFDIFGRSDGRLMLTMGNGATPDWPVASLEALFDEALKYGTAKVRSFSKAGKTSVAQQSRAALQDAGDTVELPSGLTADRSTVSRLPLTQQRFTPATMTETAPGCTFVDFGKAYFAGLELEIAKPEPGRKVIVRMGEALAGPHAVDRAPQGSVRFHSAEITLHAGQRLYVVPLREADARLMPARIGPVMPFRYVELENAPALEPGNIRQIAAFYPFNDAASDFRCPRADLVAVWDLCKHTMKATSFGGVFVDGDRERLPYEADAFINQLGWYCCTDDLTLPRHSHEHLIQHPTWPTEWILFSVLMVWEDYRYTGDPVSLAMFYEDLKAKTLIDLARPDGLISTVQLPFPKDEFAERVGKAIHIREIRDIVDWPVGERDGNRLPAVNTVVNAFHCLAVRRMADIAAVLKKPEDEARFHAAAARVLRSLNATLIDPATGLYVDGEGDTHSSLHANMFPLAFGLVPGERRAAVAAFVKSRGMACSVYGAQFLMEALFDAGLADHALALMTADGDRSWSHMVKRVGTTMTLEAWDTKYKRNQDWNHAWGAAPANILPRKVLGVEPLEPGFAKVLVQPRPGSLEWAEGRVPTRHGPVTVRFDQDDRSFRLRLDVPQGTTARIGVPKGTGGELTLDGRSVRSTESDGYLFIDDVGTGPHEVIRRSS